MPKQWMRCSIMLWCMSTMMEVSRPKRSFWRASNLNVAAQQETTESMTAHMFGGTVIVTGIYVTKGVEKGKPYVRRGRFVDTWTP